MKEQWIYKQFSTIDVGDTRLQKRAVDVAIGCAKHPEESIAGRFDKWADLQGAYRFCNSSHTPFVGVCKLLRSDSDYLWSSYLINLQ